MASQETLSVKVDFGVSGVGDTVGNANQIVEVLNRVHSAGGLSDKALLEFSKALVRVEGASRSAAGGLNSVSAAAKKMTPEFAEANKEVTELSKKLQEQAQLAAARGSQTPQQDAIKAVGLTEKDVKLIERHNDALGVNATTAAKSWRESQSQASKQTAIGNQYLYDQEKALKKQAAATQMSTQQQDSLRYASYDLGRTLLRTSAAITAVGVASVAAFASQERAFTDVERTLEGGSVESVEGLRDAFRELSTEIPKSFNEISQIATLGNQLGVAEQDLEAFTRTVTAFSTITGISADAASQAFGKLGNLLNVQVDDYDRLGSSIALVGRTTAATEAQIISIASEIAPAAAAAGVSADAVIGLSGALGSLRVPPERSRSTILQFFEKLNTSVANGGDDLRDFAIAVGTTSEELEGLVRSGQGEEVLTRFVSNAATKDTVEITQALQKLGLAGLRTNPTIRALAGNMDLFNSSIATGKQGFSENNELQRQMALIVDDLASRWQIFVNVITNFAAEVGSKVAPVLGVVLDGATSVLKVLTEFADTSIGTVVVQIAAGLAVMAAGWLAVRGAIAIATGSALGFARATQFIGGIGIRSGLFSLRDSFNAVGFSAAAAAGSTTALSASVATLGRLILPIAVIALLVSAITDLRGTALLAIDAFEFWFDTVGAAGSFVKPLVGVLFGLANAFGILDTRLASNLSNVMNFTGYFRALFQVFGVYVQQLASKVVGVVQGIAQGLSNMAAAVARWGQGVITAIAQTVGISLQQLQKLVSFLRAFSVTLGIFGKKFGAGFADGINIFNNVTDGLFDALRGFAQDLPGATSAMDDLSNAFDSFNSFSEDAQDNLDKTGGSAAKAANQIRTLVDYSNDLAEVWGRAFQIRFGPAQGLDAITSGFISLREAADEAAKRIRDLKNDIAGLSSDIDIQEYFLSIAIEYGDTKRAAAIEADLAKKRAELADKTKELQEQEDAANQSLTGNTKGNIENRKSILDLITQYQSYLQALAASGISQGALAAESEKLRRDFIEQATALGFNRDELKVYEAAFTDVARTIAAVPFAVTTDLSSLDPAILAIREFVDKANASLNSLGSGVGGALGNALGEATNEADEGGNELGYRSGSSFGNALQLASKYENDLKSAGQDSKVTAIRTGYDTGYRISVGVGDAAKNPSTGISSQVSGSISVSQSIINASTRVGNTIASGLRTGITYWFDNNFGGIPTARNLIRNVTGFQSGGYTGRGGSSEVAGFVHRGEYVIPQSGVNQATGMPYADALGRLMGGIQGRSSAPAASSAGGGVQVVALSAGSIEALRGLSDKNIYLNAQLVSESSSDQYSYANSIGAN